MGVIAVGCLAEGPVQMLEGGGRVAGIQRDGGGVDGFGGRLRSGWASRRLTLADLQEKTSALDELALVRIALNDIPEARGGRLEIMPLECPDARFIERQRLVERGLPRGRWRWRYGFSPKGLFDRGGTFGGRRD
jgi:hypothetical protein